MTNEKYVLNWHWHAYCAERDLASQALLDTRMPKIAWALHATSAKFFKGMLNEMNAMYQDRALQEMMR